MTYYYLLAGDNLELARAELEGFLETQEIENVEHSGRISKTEDHPTQLRRLALTHEVAEEVDIENYRPQGKYAVRTEDLAEGGFESSKVEREVGEKISSLSNEVDLEHPDNVVKVYNTEDGIVYTEIVEDIPRGLFEKRQNQKRPFSSPISLDPILARVMVNLSGVKAGDYVIDPFCGTGGILIEAGLCGIGVKGLDMQDEMVEGTVENLKEYGILNYEVQQGDVSEAERLFNEYNAVISDLPYGKASKVEENPVKKFLKLLENFEGKTVFMYNEPSIGRYEADFEVYVHKNLTRYIFVQ